MRPCNVMRSAQEARVLDRACRAAGAIVVLAALLLPSVAAGSLSIEPAFVEFRLDKGRPSDVITVTNVTSEETRYRAHAVHFVYTPNGDFAMVEPDEQSLAHWMKFNPKEFTLKPEESRAIRISVVAPKGLADGEYWAALRFEPLSGPTTEASDDEGHTVTLQVRSNILVPVVGSVGEPSYGGDLLELMAWRGESGVSIVAGVMNTGNTRFRLEGTYEIVDPSGSTVADGTLGEATILSGGQRVFARRAEVDLPQGEYVVRVVCTSDRLENDLAGQTTIRDEAPEGLEDAGD